MGTVLLLNGPNLHALGQREPELYGHTTLPQIEQRVRNLVEGAGHTLHAIQSAHEGALVDWLHEHRGADFALVNAAAFTHTSVALRDALKAIAVPFIEIHISNVHAREGFRHHSYLSDVAVGIIVGLGPQGYELAAQYALEHLKTH